MTPKKIADSSGFPLQIKIADIVERHQRWSVLLEEHPWNTRDLTSSGYIDLIIQYNNNQNVLMVIECKRVKEHNWVFLVPNDHNKESNLARTWYSRFINKSWTGFNWDDHYMEPYSLQSEFCAIPGQESGRNVLLDRSTSTLVNSVEALALQEKDRIDANLNHDVSQTNQFSRLYIPVIVTTASIVVSIFDPSNISLNDGSLPDDAEYIDVPFIRYRKSMGNINAYIGFDIKEASYESEKTVFIVNAQHMEYFLNNWRLISVKIM